MTVDLIAREAGCSMSSLYARFPSKDILVEAFFDEFFARSRAEAAAVFGKGAPASLEQAVTALVALFIEGYRRHRGALRAMILHGHAHPESSFAGRTGVLRREVGQGVIQWLSGRAPAARREDVARRAGFGLWLVDGAAQNAILFDRLPGVDDDQLKRQLVDVWMSYLQARPA